jgi:hypothetical protein
MKYFAVVETLELEKIPNFPNKFPMFIMASEEMIRKYNATMVKAVQLGFNPKKRKLCFTLRCSEGVTHEEVFNLAKELPEVTEEQYNFLLDIPHWNPIDAALRVLESYIELIEIAKKQGEDFGIDDMLKKSFKSGKDKEEIKVNPK